MNGLEAKERALYNVVHLGDAGPSSANLATLGRYRRVLESFRKPLPWGQLTVASFLGSYLSMMMWLYSYKLIPASVSAILNQSTNAWMVLLAWLVLHEYIGMRKIYGLILTTGGVLMMLLA